MFRIATKVAFRPGGIYRNPASIRYPGMHACMPCELCSGDKIRQKKGTNPKRKRAALGVTTEADTSLIQKKKATDIKPKTAYSEVRMVQAEDRLGIVFSEFEPLCIPIDQMLGEVTSEIKGLRNDQVQKAKEIVYENIVQFITGEGYPSESQEDFKEANAHGLVLLIVLPILTRLKDETGRSLLLLREKEILAKDLKTRGFQEFVAMDIITIWDKKFVFVVEAKKSSVGQAKRQCFLALKEMRDNNGGGIVYGFVTSGGEWQMIRYDHRGFAQTDHFHVLCRNMKHEKERWIKEHSAIVDCIHMALRNGGSGGA